MKTRGERLPIFLGWSGDRSRAAAEALRDWMSDVIQALDPWVSSRDIAPGQRWGTEIDLKLEEAHFGVLCLTSDNVKAPWMNYEAGALSKMVSPSRVVPYLIDDITPNELAILASPLARFQQCRADKAGTLRLLQELNAALVTPLSGDRLARVFERSWGSLETALTTLPSPGPTGHRPGFKEVWSWVRRMGIAQGLQAELPHGSEPDGASSSTGFRRPPSHDVAGRFGQTSGRPFVEAMIVLPRLEKRFQVSLLLDSGADRTVLMPGDLTVAGVDPDSLDPATGTTVSGLAGKMELWAEQALVVLSSDGHVHVFETRALLFPKGNLQGPSILGQDILGRCRVELDRGQKRVVLEVMAPDFQFKTSEPG